MILKAYEYWFYRCHQWSTKVNGKVADHKFSACLMISGHVYLFVCSFIIFFLNIFGGENILGKLPPLDTAFPFLIAAIVLLPMGNYIFFNFNNRYQKILDRYRTESAAEAKRGNVILLLFTVGTAFLFFASVIIGLNVR